jgi:hypothetical protein
MHTRLVGRPARVMCTQWIKKRAKASPLEPLLELETRRHAEGRQIDVWATTEDPRAQKE